MKATNEQLETIKEIVIKTLNYYIKNTKVKTEINK